MSTALDGKVRGEEQFIDWSGLDEMMPDYNTEVGLVIEQAARMINSKYSKTYGEFFISTEDLVQQGALVVATTARMRRHINEGSLGYLQHELWCDLDDFYMSEVSRRRRDVLEPDRDEPQAATQSGDEEVVHIPLKQQWTLHRPLDTPDSDYTKEAVEEMLPAVWDETYAYGFPPPDTSPDPDMPKGSTNKARANNHWAYIVDVKVGWAKAPLTKKERVAVLLRYGMGWEQRDIAYNQDASQQTISKRIAKGLDKITARMNNGIWDDLEEVEV